MLRLIPLLAIAFALAPSAQATGNPKTSSPVHPCLAANAAVDEAGFVPIGGIEQWITVKGEDCANPVILFLHGGPGNPLSPYAAEIYGAWAEEFTLVQWDQRGSGRTYGRNLPDEESALTIERMRDDGIEVAEYLARRFGKDRIILRGSSWGSILGVSMVQARPGRFLAYLGVSQLVSYEENQSASHAAVLDRARAGSDSEALAVLDEVGPPPWTDPRSFGKVRRIIRRYEAKVTSAPPESWWQADPTYATPEDLAHAEAGEEYSFLSFVGYRGDGMFSKVDLPALGTRFAVPVFLVMGAEDLLSTPEVARRYFDTIDAPEKAFVLVPNAGHDPNQAMTEAELRLLPEWINKLGN